jgi:uncharacterized membrane protein YvlD (DUF360 family)
MKKFIRHLIRFAVYALVTLGVLWVADLFMDSFNMLTWQAGLLAVVIVSLLNTFLRPLLVRVTIGLNMATFGLFSLIISAVIVWLADWLVPGFEAQGLWVLIVLSFLLAGAHTYVSNTLLAQEDRELDRLRVIERFAKKQSGTPPTTPGLIMLEIDGLSAPVLRQAMADGHMPNLRAWIESGSHTLVGWDASVPSMTSAMQAGILHGSHTNIPAFRFWDKENARLLVSNHPKDAQIILSPNQDGNGLLKGNGLAVNNWTSGDAGESLLTFTDMAAHSKNLRDQGNLLFGFFADAYLIQQSLAAMVADMWQEWKESRYQRQHDVQPRIDRHFPYPIVRAATVAFLPPISVYLVIQKMFEGVDTAYTTLVSYDEVAHHSGVTRPDALRILEEVDQQIEWVNKARQSVKRPYEIIVLSDHGQSQGATFKQRYGKTVSDLVSELTRSTQGADTVVDTSTGDEGLQYLGLLLAQASSGDSLRAKMLNSAVKKRSSDGFVKMGEEANVPTDAEAADAESIVCASGNLALVYLKASNQRMSVEEILAHYPRLVPGLLTHPGVGVIVAQSEEAGPVVLGKNGGIYQLADGRITEPNPLAPYSKHTARHLLALAEYKNCGDLVLFSQFDPVTLEGAAFEELVGFHGGIGGWQTQPFLLYPSHFESEPLPEIVGAGEVYQVIKRWRTHLGHE